MSITYTINYDVEPTNNIFLSDNIINNNIPIPKMSKLMFANYINSHRPNTRNVYVLEKIVNKTYILNKKQYDNNSGELVEENDYGIVDNKIGTLLYESYKLIGSNYSEESQNELKTVKNYIYKLAAKEADLQFIESAKIYDVYEFKDNNITRVTTVSNAEERTLLYREYNPSLLLLKFKLMFVEGYLIGNAFSINKEDYIYYEFYKNDKLYRKFYTPYPKDQDLFWIKTLSEKYKYVGERVDYYISDDNVKYTMIDEQGKFDSEYQKQNNLIPEIDARYKIVYNANGEEIFVAKYDIYGNLIYVKSKNYNATFQKEVSPPNITQMFTGLKIGK